MEARDVMTLGVVTVGPDMPVAQVAKLMLDNRISGVPVLTDDKLVGIVSEGDFLRRAELGTERHHSRWLEIFATGTSLAGEYVKTHGQTAGDIMSRDVVTVAPDTSLGDVATILESKHIKRVPVVEEGRLVGIISRANLLHALATLPTPPPTRAVSGLAESGFPREAEGRSLEQRFGFVRVPWPDPIRRTYASAW
jgi:CBS domain-containing protein